jgi:polar amino acid transport system substrate-binding protein
VAVKLAEDRWWISIADSDLLQWVNVFILHKKLGGELNTISETWLGQPLPALPTF